MEQELMPWHKTWLVDIEYDRVDLVKEGANSKAHIKLMKTKGGNTMDFAAILAKMKPEHAAVIAAEIEKAKQSQATTGSDGAGGGNAKDGTTAMDETNTDEVLKSVKDPAVRALLESQIAKSKDAELKVKAAEMVAKSLQDKADEIVAVSKAKELPNLGAEEVALASVYKKLNAVDNTLAEDVFGIFKAASALIKESGAFVEIGKGAGNAGEISVGETGAWAQIDAAADVIAKSKNIKKEAAIAEAISANPALYAAYLRAQD